MIKNNSLQFGKKAKNKRDAFYDVKKFIDESKNEYGEILVLYGVRRTGKTTIMEQIIDEFKDKEQCAYYTVQNSDTMDDITKAMIKERNEGTTLICLDEITRASDFITEASVLPDIFAKQGMKIIVSGTDSLGFNFAEKELYGRTQRISTTYISLAEHCRVLETTDIDDYIQYGGLMRKGEKSERFVNDYESALKYLDEAVVENIVSSIKKLPRNNKLEKLSQKELQTIIHKIVEKYSGQFDEKIMQNALTKVSIGENFKDAIGFEDEKIIDSFLLNKGAAIQSFLKEINADTSIKTQITEDMVKELQSYLIDMDVISATSSINYKHKEDLGWYEKNEEKKIFIIQPAIKFFHLQKGKEFIDNSEYYEELSQKTKNYLKDKLEGKIKGFMTEYIIDFDTAKSLPKERYTIIKPEFKMEHYSGEYDMLIYDSITDKHWDFEIKYNKNIYPEQCKHLLNSDFLDKISKDYGTRAQACVLYRGETTQTELGIIYINITDFALAIDKYHNINAAFADLTKDIFPEGKYFVSISENTEVVKDGTFSESEDLALVKLNCDINVLESIHVFDYCPDDMQIELKDGTLITIDEFEEMLEKNNEEINKAPDTVDSFEDEEFDR